MNEKPCSPHKATTADVRVSQFVCFCSLFFDGNEWERGRGERRGTEGGGTPPMNRVNKGSSLK